MFLCSAIEHFVKKKEDIVNIKKDDGYMPLHLTALNNHLDVVTALAEMVIVRLNAQNNIIVTCSVSSFYHAIYIFVVLLSYLVVLQS